MYSFNVHCITYSFISIPHFFRSIALYQWMDPMSATMVKLDGKRGVAPADKSPKPVFWDGLNLLIGFSERKFSRQELFIPKRMPGSCLAQPLAICQRLGAPVELLPGEKLQSFSLPGPIWRCRLIFLPRHATFSRRLPLVN